MCFPRNTAALSRYHCYSAEAINSNECVSVFLCYLPTYKWHLPAHAPWCRLRPAPLYNNFPNCRINETIFEKTLQNIKSVFWFSLQIMSGTFLILRRTQWDIIINIHRSSCKVPFSLVRFQQDVNFIDSFSKNTQISKFIKIHLVGAELFCADGHTDRRLDGYGEANIRVSQLCKRA